MLRFPNELGSAGSFAYFFSFQTWRVARVVLLLGLGAGQWVGLNGDPGKIPGLLGAVWFLGSSYPQQWMVYVLGFLLVFFFFYLPHHGLGAPRGGTKPASASSQLCYFDQVTLPQVCFLLCRGAKMEIQ